MTITTKPEVTALKSEIERLQADLDAAVDKMRGMDGDKWSNGHDSTLASAEKMWTEVKRQAQQVGHEIEERPLVSAITALGAGIAIGMLFGGRRG
ncbi:MAG TPA: hypothetical protein VNF04_00715 [Stellaceae bacterium]|nr:hypothetical protein [Stellaceae bacterium]